MTSALLFELVRLFNMISRDRMWHPLSFSLALPFSLSNQPRVLSRMDPMFLGRTFGTSHSLFVAIVAI